MYNLTCSSRYIFSLPTKTFVFVDLSCSFLFIFLFNLSFCIQTRFFIIILSSNWMIFYRDNSSRSLIPNTAVCYPKTPSRAHSTEKIHRWMQTDPIADIMQRSAVVAVHTSVTKNRLWSKYKYNFIVMKCAMLSIVLSRLICMRHHVTTNRWCNTFPS
jgi:hypothetical protein